MEKQYSNRGFTLSVTETTAGNIVCVDYGNSWFSAMAHDCPENAVDELVGWTNLLERAASAGGVRVPLTRDELGGLYRVAGAAGVWCGVLCEAYVGAMLDTAERDAVVLEVFDVPAEDAHEVAMLENCSVKVGGELADRMGCAEEVDVFMRLYMIVSVFERCWVRVRLPDAREDMSGPSVIVKGLETGVTGHGCGGAAEVPGAFPGLPTGAYEGLPGLGVEVWGMLGTPRSIAGLGIPAGPEYLFRLHAALACALARIRLSGSFSMVLEYSPAADAYVPEGLAGWTWPGNLPDDSIPEHVARILCVNSVEALTGVEDIREKVLFSISGAGLLKDGFDAVNRPSGLYAGDTLHTLLYPDDAPESGELGCIPLHVALFGLVDSMPEGPVKVSVSVVKEKRQ